MSKKHSGDKSQPVFAAPGMLVNSSRDFVKNCDAIVAKAAGLRYLKSAEAIETHVRKQFVLSGEEAVPIGADRRYSAVKVYESAETIFWLAPSIKFEVLEGKEYVTTISLVVFSGNMTDEKVPLLRAEWDCNPEGKEKPSKERPHAQPHWHVYSSRFREMSAGPSQFDAKPEVRDFPSQDESPNVQSPHLVWEDGENFHFAMLALWSRGGRLAHHNSSEPEGLIKWFDGCINYILGQLQFICDKKKTTLLSPPTPQLRVANGL